MNEGAGGELVGEQAPNQFFRRSRQLLVAITFDPELRLTHGLRLREALIALFPSITHAIRGVGEMVVEMTQFGVGSGKLVLGCSMARRKSRVSIELGVQGLESTPPSKFHEPPKIESVRWITEPIRFHPVFKFNVQNALRINSSSSESILKRRNMISKGFQRFSDDDWSGCISCKLIPLFYKNKNREPRYLEGPEGLTTRLMATADHRE
ncbi:hypothetical protein PIB30_056361 [Stylosanthes scabra]|uniref:Uncharacterized protein n=1 Tax=Stylosanthes scabra TaxID=79078 RepID=A0ABU6QKC2_9FABA|nr:hypothetical protein [Stylosanthes scabra]